MEVEGSGLDTTKEEEKTPVVDGGSCQTGGDSIRDHGYGNNGGWFYHPNTGKTYDGGGGGLSHARNSTVGEEAGGEAVIPIF